MTDPRYSAALLDWLACAARGGARAGRAGGSRLGDRWCSRAAAGHVLDFDDTYLPGLAHLSAPAAPAALVVGAADGATVGDVLAAYARGLRGDGRAARAPATRRSTTRGWHPTAVCGGVGAAVAGGARCSARRARTRVALALLRAGGLQRGVRLGRQGAAGRAGGGGRGRRGAARGARARDVALADAVAAASSRRTARAAPEPADGPPAIAENWIKA